MKLTDCDASFYGSTSEGRTGLGVVFDCPLCVKAGLPRQRSASLAIAFDKPLDGGEPEKGWTDRKGVYHPKLLWNRVGETLETLTLAPSIDASSHTHDHGAGWHGHVTVGQVVGGGV